MTNPFTTTMNGVEENKEQIYLTGTRYIQFFVKIKR